MDAARYPTSIADLADWRKRHGTTALEARRRLVQFVILASISSSAALVSRVAFKGDNALRFIHGNERSALDLDFSAEGDFPDDPGDIKRLLDAALWGAERRHEVRARCQGIHREPPGLDETRPTYISKVCYQLPGDKHHRDVDARLAARMPFSEVVEVEISINDVLCETGREPLSPGAEPLRVCTLDDIIAEKLRALLPQVPRNRSRPQDVFDIASMVRRHGGSMDLEKVASFLIRKAEAREIAATRGAFGDEVRDRAAAPYDAQIRPFTTDFIPFDEA